MTETVIRVTTQDQYDRLMKILDELGYKWGGGDKVINRDYFYVYKSNTCIYLADKEKYVLYGDIESCDNPTTIKPFEEFERIHRLGSTNYNYNDRLIKAIKKTTS